MPCFFSSYMKEFIYKSCLITCLLFIFGCIQKEEVSEFDPQLSVLSIGSSFGVNTFISFPSLVSAAGVSFLGGNLFLGSCTLSDIRRICENKGNFHSGALYSSRSHKWETSTSSIIEMLRLAKWDIIILQRAAPGQKGGSDEWTESMSNDLAYILSFINDNTDYNPEILFNSSFSLPVGKMKSRSAQTESVKAIMDTALEMKSEFGINIIPSAIAIHNARCSELAYVPTRNSNGYSIPDMTGSGDHLDIGVGSYVLGCLLFEQICGERFGLSIRDLDYLPTLRDVHNNAGGFPDQDFTPINRDLSLVAKEAAISALCHPSI